MKLNQEQLKAILDDLYAADPELKQFGQELEKAIREIIELRPQIDFDENFRDQLRQQLMRRARELGAKSEKNSWFAIFWSRPSFALAGVFTVLVLAAGAYYFWNGKDGAVNFVEIGAYKKIALRENAFGSLNFSQNSANNSGLGGENKMSPEAASLPAADSGAVKQTPSAIYGRGGGGADSKTIMPMVYYSYVYKGEPLKLESSVEILRRKGFESNAASLAGLFKSFGGLVDLPSFGSLEIQNINLVSQNDYGYLISADIQSGLIYVSQNWSKWPQPYAACSSEQCYQENRLKITDVLSDEESVRIANDFLKKHGIGLENYGQPEITDIDWRAEYEKASEKSQFYIPETVNVLYPLKVGGAFVFDEGGNKTGLNISVDVRQKKVSGASNISSQVYEASNYPAETDSAKVLSVVEQGGYWGYSYPEESAKKIEIEVGTPKTEYVLMASYNQGETKYLLVPSSIFPVIKAPADPNYYYPKNVVVPLAKELLEQRSSPVYWLKGGRGGATDSVNAAPPSASE